MHSVSFEKKYCAVQRNIWKHSSWAGTHQPHFRKVFGFIPVALSLRGVLTQSSARDWEEQGHLGGGGGCWGAEMAWTICNRMAQLEHNCIPM